ncbi:MAG: MFS transporter [Treponema sp.]|nr:MFS transporter [Treponema sp.]
MALFAKRPAFFDEIYRGDVKIARFLTVLVLFGVSYGLYLGVMTNYLVEIIRVSPFERGIVEVFRELPGLFLVFILALLYKYSDSRLFKVGVSLCAGGLVGLLLSSSNQFLMTKVFVVLFMVLFSVGEHLLMPLRSSIAMDLAKKEKSGAALGLNASFNQLGHIGGLLITMCLFFILRRGGYAQTDLMWFRIIFGVSVALMVTATLVVLALKETELKAPRQRFYINWKFRKYYALEIFYGGRKQIFATFAPFMLVAFYGADPGVIALLRTISACCSMVCAPVVGRLIDRIGYRTVMVVDSFLLIIVCLTYGFAHVLFPMERAFFVVGAAFVLDALISMGRMAANVYAKRIASSVEEVTATISTGISVDHVISISMALLGGIILSLTGYEVLFAFAAILGLGKCMYTLTIKKNPEEAMAQAAAARK